MNEISEKAVEAAHAAYWSTDDGPSGNDRPAMRAALTAALPHLMGWQPIEIAPRDGTRFLCATIIPRHRLLIAMFGAGGILLDERLQPATWPMTHWMPLPPAPTNQERGNGSITEDTK